MSDHKRPVEQAVEVALYAPLGFALEAKRLLPTFVARGRQQVQMAKVIGQFAVTQGEKEARVRLSRAQEQAESILAELGLRGGPEPSTPARGPHVPSAAPEPAPEPTPTPARSSAAAAELSIADYDSLAASQVIPRLEGLGADELEAVRRYETAHRGRKTILGKIAQLQDQ
ncbi:MAG: hypothetical protein R2746_11870 [Acidimicrobiales bacterium]|nr:hypothetical protein [Actinomycetota bacterium]